MLCSVVSMADLWFLLRLDILCVTMFCFSYAIAYCRFLSNSGTGVSHLLCLM